MAELRATSSNLRQVIESTARRPADVASALSTFCFAVLAVDLFAIATGLHNWTATAVHIGRVVAGGSLSTFSSIGIVLATLAFLALLGELNARASGLKHLLMSDLATVVPKRPWAATPSTYWRAIGVWIVVLPLMATISLTLADSTGLSRITRLPVLTGLEVLLTVSSAWVVSALCYGIWIRRDRYAIASLVAVFIGYFAIVVPFGRSLQDTAPILFTTHQYGAPAPDAALIGLMLFYVVLLSRTLLAFEMRRDVDQTVLTIEDSDTESPVLVIDRGDLRFNRPHYLYVDSGIVPVIAFARTRRASDFLYVPFHKIREYPLRVDDQEIKLFNLKRIKGIIEKVKLQIDEPVHVSARLVLELQESTFAASAQNEFKRFTQLEQQALSEIFSPDGLESLLRLWFSEVVHRQAEDILAPLRPIKAFVELFPAKLDSAVLRGDTQGRKEAALLDRNSAGAMGQGEQAAREIDSGTERAEACLAIIAKAEGKIDGLRLQLPDLFKERMLTHIEQRCAGPNESLRTEVQDFASALGPRLIEVSCARPALLESLTASFSAMTGKITETSREIQGRRTEGAEADAARLERLVSDPGLRGRDKVEIIGYGRHREPQISERRFAQLEGNDEESGTPSGAQGDLEASSPDTGTSRSSGSRPGQM